MGVHYNSLRFRQVFYQGDLKLQLDLWGKNHSFLNEFKNTIKEKDDNSIIELQCKNLMSYYSKYKTVFLNQVHGNKVIMINKYNINFSLMKADAMFSIGMDKLNLAIRIADCVPILFFSYELKLIGGIHAGWRGLHQNIIKHTIDLLGKKLQNKKDLQKIYFWVGPHIQNYEVGLEVFRLFSSQVILKNKIKKKINLLKLVQQEFQDSGIAKKQLLLDQSSWDTFTNLDLYTHRLGDNLRNFANISLEFIGSS